MNQLIYQQQQNEMQQYMSRLENASRTEDDCLFVDKFPVSRDYGTPAPDELLAMQSSLGRRAAQDAGACRAASSLLAVGQINTPRDPWLAPTWACPGSRLASQSGPVPLDLFSLELVNEDDFWKLGDNVEREIFAEQFFSLEDDYVTSLESHESSGPFSPETQLVGGQMNPMYGTPSVVTNNSCYNSNEYCIAGDQVGNAFDESANQDAFLQHVFNVCNVGEPNEPAEVILPYDGMLENFEVYHTSVDQYWKKIKADQQLEFDLMSETKVTFVADANGNVVPMATVMLLVKSIQGVPCSKIMNVLLDSGGSASMISNKVLPTGATVKYESSSTLVNTLAGAVQSAGKVEVQGLHSCEGQE